VKRRRSGVVIDAILVEAIATWLRAQRLEAISSSAAGRAISSRRSGSPAPRWSRCGSDGGGFSGARSAGTGRSSPRSGNPTWPTRSGASRARMRTSASP